MEAIKFKVQSNELAEEFMALINDKEYYLVCQDNGDTCALLLPENRGPYNSS